jgi:AraC-like DNA-binding protein
MELEIAMNQHGAFGRRLGAPFGLPDAPVLVARTLRKAQLAVTRLRCDVHHYGMTAPLAREDAFLVGLACRDCPDREMWEDGKPCVRRPLAAGDTLIYDLKRNPIACLRSPFEPLFFYVPRAALNAVADDAGAPRVGDLHYRPGVPIADRVIRALGNCLLPGLEEPEQVNAVFAEHLMYALCAHIARVYGNMRTPRFPVRGGLAPWQERRAKEMLGSNLEGSTSLAAVAGECGLSLSHFTRAFRQSTGLPPHRWLLHLRIEKAKDLLRDSAMSLAEIALASGFANQSHFTRVFSASVGRSPGASRRLHKIC